MGFHLAATTRRTHCDLEVIELRPILAVADFAAVLDQFARLTGGQRHTHCVLILILAVPGLVATSTQQMFQ